MDAGLVRDEHEATDDEEDDGAEMSESECSCDSPACCYHAPRVLHEASQAQLPQNASPAQVAQNASPAQLRQNATPAETGAERGPDRIGTTCTHNPSIECHRMSPTLPRDPAAQVPQNASPAHLPQNASPAQVPQNASPAQVPQNAPNAQLQRKTVYNSRKLLIINKN